MTNMFALTAVLELERVKNIEICKSYLIPRFKSHLKPSSNDSTEPDASLRVDVN